MVFYGSANPFILILAFVFAHCLVGLVLAKTRGRLPLLWRFVGSFSLKFEKRLNRKKRSAGTRLIRGLMLLAIVVLFLMMLLQAGRLLVPSESTWLITLLVLSFTVTILAPWQVTRKVYKSLVHKKTETGKPDKLGAIEALRPFVDAEITQDEHALTRQAIEFSVWAFVRCVIGPLFWYLVYGINGMVIYVTVAAMDKAFGNVNEAQREFGRAAAIIDDILNFVPARIAALLIALAAWVAPGCSAKRSLETMLSQGGKYNALNAGWPLGAMAGALNVTLGGPVYNKGKAKTKKWIGAKGSSAKIDPAVLRAGLNIYLIMILIILCICSLSILKLL